MLGPEPTKIDGKIDYLQYLNWLNYHYDITKGKKWLIEYCAKNNMSLKNTREITMTMCSIARMLNRGIKLSPDSVNYLHRKINNKVMDRLQKRSEAISLHRHFSFPLDDFEEVLDNFYRGEYVYFDPETYKMLVEKKARPIDAKTVADYYRQILLDLDCPGYSYLGKRKLGAYRKFLGKMVDDAETYASNQHKPRKPRKKKIKSIEQLVSKLKFKLIDNDLRITSIAPEKIIGAEILYVYDTKYRKLTCLVAENCTSFTIKGTTILSIDPAKSVSKILRKPEEFLSTFMNGGKVAKRRTFDGLKTKATEANGRMNEHKLILQAY